MAYSVLRVYSELANFEKAKILRTEYSSNYNPEEELHQSLKESELQEEEKLEFITNYKGCFPDHLSQEIDSIFVDAYQIASEMHNHEEFEKDKEKWEELKEMLAEPLRSTTEIKFTQELFSLLYKASNNEIDFASNRIEYIRDELIELLNASPSLNYLSLIIEYYEVSNEMSGIQFLQAYFKQSGFKLEVDENEMISTQSGYMHYQMKSAFEQMFYNFICGDLTQITPQMNEIEVDIAGELNEMVQNGYEFDMEESEMLNQSMSNWNGNKMNKSTLRTEDDRFYQLITRFLSNEEVSGSTIIKDKKEELDALPFALEAFFYLIRGEQKKMSMSSVNRMQNETSNNVRLLLLALERNFVGLYEELENYSLYEEFFVVSLFIEEELSEFYIPTSNQIDKEIVNDVVSDTLNTSIGESVLPINLICKFVSENKAYLQKFNHHVFSLYENEKVLNDFIKAYVAFLVGGDFELSNDEKFIFAEMLIAKKLRKQALQILEQIDTSEDYEYFDTLVAEEIDYLLLEELSDPKELGFIFETLKDFSITNPNTKQQISQELKFSKFICDFCSAYWSGDNVVGFLKKFDFKFEVSEPFVEHIDVFATFLLQAVQKSQVLVKEFKEYLLGFDVGAEVKNIMAEM